MVRPNIMKERVAINILFDYQDIREFEELVGKGNISKEIRAMIKDQIEIRKKEEALQNSDYLKKLPSSADISSLSIERDINKYISNVKNDGKTMIIAINSSADLYNIAHVHKEIYNVAMLKRKDIINEKFKNNVLKKASYQ